MKKRVYAAAVCAAFSLSAFAQSALDPVRTAAGRAAIDRAQSTGFLAGLERAVKTPLEIVWLRASAEESLWSDPALSRASAVGRTTWRYVFGGNAQFAPRPNEVARLVVSTLNLPQGPVAAGRLDLTGTGRLYLVTPETPNATPPDRLAMILAAGSTLHISDATSPSIHIELKAPENRPLLLGNLAASDIGRVLSLLVKPGSANAFEASVSENGKVALRAGGEVQLAALLPNAELNDSRLAAVQPPKAPADHVLLASLSPSGEAHPRPRAPGTPRQQIGIDVQFEMGQVAGVMGSGRMDGTLAASLSPRDMEPVIARGAQPARNHDPVEHRPELVQVAFAADTPVANAERAIVASLAPAMASPATELRATAQAARPEVKTDFSAELSVVASTAETAPTLPARTQIAALAPPAGALEFKASAGAVAAIAPQPVASPDLARMRAEIDAEIARERERLAAQFKPQVIGAPAPKRFVLGV